MYSDLLSVQRSCLNWQLLVMLSVQNLSFVFDLVPETEVLSYSTDFD